MADTDPTLDASSELLAVAPLLAIGSGERSLVGPCVLLRSGARVFGFAGRTLAPVGEPRFVATSLDGTTRVEITSMKLSRFVGIVEFELDGAAWPERDVVPLAPARVGTMEHAKRGSPFVVGFAKDAGGYRRVPLRVRIETVETAGWGGSGDDVVYHVAHPREPVEAGVSFDGAPLFARHPASRVLGRAAETLAYGIACTTGEALEGHDQGARPLAELVPLPIDHGW